MYLRFKTNAPKPYMLKPLQGQLEDVHGKPAPECLDHDVMAYGLGGHESAAKRPLHRVLWQALSSHASCCV